MATLPFEKSGYLFIESLVNPNTGLVASYEGECYTTTHKNSLAAMAMLHESNRTAAERIFDVFARYYHTQRHGFHGLPKDWEVCAGLPDTTSIHWEGEAAFLLLALNYYREITGGHGKYQDLAAGLTSWLMQRACECEHLVAEGVANTYAAFENLASFRRSEIWTFDHATEITAYSAYTEEQFINVEVSAQLLLAWKIWQSDLQLDLTPLLAEL
jgi:hypothetical protein